MAIILGHSSLQIFMAKCKYSPSVCMHVHLVRKITTRARQYAVGRTEHVLTPGFFSVLLRSEDYYGDLDLKSIRKSELLAGIQSEPRKPAVLKPRPSTVAGPTRPSPIQE